MSKNGHYCSDCRKPRCRSGTCCKCKALRRLLHRIHNDKGSRRSEAGRREEIHRARAASCPRVREGGL